MQYLPEPATVVDNRGNEAVSTGGPFLPFL